MNKNTYLVPIIDRVAETTFPGLSSELQGGDRDVRDVTKLGPCK